MAADALSADSWMSDLMSPASWNASTGHSGCVASAPREWRSRTKMAMAKAIPANRSTGYLLYSTLFYSAPDLFSPKSPWIWPWCSENTFMVYCSSGREKECT